MKPVLAIYNVDVKMKDDEIRELIKNGMTLCKMSGDGAMLSVDGYGDDPRDLWDIPEAVNFAKKLFAMGVCSVLTISTYLDPQWGGSSGGKPFGAFEVWLLAKEEMGKTIEHPQLVKLFEDFKVDLLKSNAVAAAMVQGVVSDGQHRV